jgi:hypothetical protein
MNIYKSYQNILIDYGFRMTHELLHCLTSIPFQKKNDKIKDLRPVCLLKSSFFYKMNSEKVNYFLIFGSVMKNKLENTFQCLVMS